MSTTSLKARNYGAKGEQMVWPGDLRGQKSNQAELPVLNSDGKPF